MKSSTLIAFLVTVAAVSGVAAELVIHAHPYLGMAMETLLLCSLRIKSD